MRIPARTKIDLGYPRAPSPDVRIRGGGRFIGILLVREPIKRDSLTVVSLAVRYCERAACATGRKAHWTFVIHPITGNRLPFDIPPGDYRLVLITDGAPVKVRLRLRGLEGTTEFTRGSRVRSSIGRLTPRLSTAPLHNVHWAGQTDTLFAPGLIFDMQWIAGNPSGVTDIGQCFYKGVPPGDERFAYAPDCEKKGAQEWRSFTISTGIAFSEEMWGFYTPLRPGRWSHGGYWQAASVLHEAGALTALVEYR